MKYYTNGTAFMATDAAPIDGWTEITEAQYNDSLSKRRQATRDAVNAERNDLLLRHKAMSDALLDTFTTEQYEFLFGVDFSKLP